jgi:hypothetical protein
MAGSGVVPECGLVVEGIACPSPASQVSCFEVQGEANGLTPCLRARKDRCKTENRENYPELSKYA